MQAPPSSSHSSSLCPCPLISGELKGRKDVRDGLLRVFASDGASNSASLPHGLARKLPNYDTLPVLEM